MTLLRPGEVAEKLRVHPGTLVNWRVGNRGPTYVKIEGQVFYPSDALDAYIKARLVRPGAR